MNVNTSPQLALLAALVLAGQSLPAQQVESIQEATAEQVRACRPLGQIVGDSAVCSKARAKKSAVTQALGLGATHIVWLEVKCVIMVGEKATARIFDCSNNSPSLEEVFEDYLATDPNLASRTVAATNSPRVMTSKDIDGDAEDLSGRGFVLAGYAGVSGGRLPLDTIRKKALSAGAELVLIHAKDAGTETDYQSVTAYNRGGTSVGFRTSQVSGNVAGESLSLSSSGTAIVSDPGSTQTELVPYSQRRFETQLLFWRKLQSNSLGLILDFLPAAERQRLSRNTGAYVVAVEDETPGFFANIVRGDIIVAVDGAEVRTPNEFNALVDQQSAASFRVRVLRNAAAIDLEARK